MYETQERAGNVTSAKIETARAIPEACERLEKAHHFLNDTINELANRLQPVLGPERPSEVGKGGDAPSRQGLSSAITREAATAEIAAERIQEMMHRLEL